MTIGKYFVLAFASRRQRHPAALIAALRMWWLTLVTVAKTNSSSRVRKIGDIFVIVFDLRTGEVIRFVSVVVVN